VSTQGIPSAAPATALGGRISAPLEPRREYWSVPDSGTPKGPRRAPRRASRLPFCPGAAGRIRPLVSMVGVCLGVVAIGRAFFNTLLYRRAEPYFYGSDCLWLNGRDLRGLPLIERKRILRDLVPPQPSRLLYVDHLAGGGVDLYRAACEKDLEGIVAKLAQAPYGTEPSTWVKFKNRPTVRLSVGGNGLRR